MQTFREQYPVETFSKIRSEKTIKIKSVFIANGTANFAANRGVTFNLRNCYATF